MLPKQYQRRGRSIRDIVLIVVLICIAILIVVTNFPITSAIILLGIVTLIVIVLGYLLAHWKLHLQRRNDKLRVELLLGGSYEAQLRDIESRAEILLFESTALIRKMKDSPLFAESTDALYKIESIWQEATELTRMVREERAELKTLKRRLAKLMQEEEKLHQQQLELRRQTTFVNESRKKLEGLLARKKEAEDEMLLIHA